MMFYIVTQKVLRLVHITKKMENTQQSQSQSQIQPNNSTGKVRYYLSYFCFVPLLKLYLHSGSDCRKDAWDGYQCGYCGAEFSSWSDMNIHRLVDHGHGV